MIKMANFLFLVVVAVSIFAKNIDAQRAASCASGGPGYCYCDLLSSGISLECNGYYSPENIMSEIEFHKPQGPIVSLTISNIGYVFNYVPDDFLVGNQIPSVRFQCSHGFAVNQGILTFSANAFRDGSGTCGLAGNLTIQDCNIRQFDTATLTNCNQLQKLAFMDSHVDKIINIPSLDSLKNFTVYSPRQWFYATQKGLSQMSLAPGALLPLLSYLDLSGNSLNDDSIEFVSQLTVIEEMHLEGNNFTVVPELTNSFHLHTVSMTLNSTETLISVLLPNPRAQLRSLRATFDSKSQAIHDVISLEGMFVQDVINFKLNMTKFSEEVFLVPLQTNGLTINLNPASRFACGCSISWLVRDNPTLLNQINNGTCTDGRPFQSIPAEEVSCCSNKSLLLRIDRLQKENDNLKAMQSSRCNRECPLTLPVTSQQQV